MADNPENAQQLLPVSPGSPHDSISLSPPPPISRIGLNDHKAGMKGLDKDKINQIILESSKGSKYYENELQKERKTKEKIDAMLKEVSSLNSSTKESAKMSADNEINTMFESTRDLSHVIVHIDMDAFYAAVEMRDDPSLCQVPMAVGGQSMLSTSNYIARRYGVRAGMPGFIAKKLCPQLVIVRSHFDKYSSVAQKVREILVDYDPLFSPMGLDEAYLDLTDYITELLRNKEREENTKEEDKERKEDVKMEVVIEEKEEENCEEIKDLNVYINEAQKQGQDGVDNEEERDFERDDIYIDNNSMSNQSMESDYEAPYIGDATHSSCPLSPIYWSTALTVVNDIRQRIHEVTQLTASAGVAVNKMLAKIGSDINKPNGQFLVPATREGILDFMKNLPIRKVSGIGKVTEKMLNGLNIEKCGHLYEQRAILKLLFSKSSFDHFMNISLGIGSCNVHNEWERKSISTERTFSDISNLSDLYEKCHELCQSLAEEVIEKNIRGRTITLKLKTNNFEVKQRSMTFPKTTVNSLTDIHRAAKSLLETELTNNDQKLTLRLMGVRLSGLESSSPIKKRPTHTTLDQFFTVHIKQENEEEVKIQQEVQQEMQQEMQQDIEVDIKTEDEEESAKKFKRDEILHSVCPICSITLFDGTDNTLLNQHIDECLNKSTISEITHTPTTPTSTIPKTVLPLATKPRSKATTLRGSGTSKGRSKKKSKLIKRDLNTSLDSYFK